MTEAALEAAVGWRAAPLHWSRRLVAILARPTDVASLSVFRIALGLLVATSALRFIAYGWIERFFVQPRFHFKYWGFSWVPVWSETGMYVHFALLAVLGLCLAAGLFYRVAAALTFVGFTWVQLMDASLYLNHYYLVSLLLLLAAIMPLGRAWSLDAWRRPERRVASFPAWCTHLLRFQIAAVYFYAGLAKLTGDWLLHAQPLNIWLHARSDMPLVGALFDQPWFAFALGWAGFGYDLTIWAWLSWSKSRPYAYAALLAFHTIVGLLLNIGMFPFIMTAAALVFFPPSWPRRLLRWRRDEPRTAAPEQTGALPSRRWRLALIALGAFAAVQLLLPLRHYLYPGNVLWTEEGMRWAWKVVVREKNGSVVYRVRFPDGREHLVPPRRYLADYQEREMSGQPDLILQLAHHIADDYARRGEGPVEVRVDAVVSLNGRRAEPLVDPSVDLTEIDDGLAPAGWILPSPSGPPPLLRPIGG